MMLRARSMWLALLFVVATFGGLATGAASAPPTNERAKRPAGTGRGPVGRQGKPPRGRGEVLRRAGFRHFTRQGPAAVTAGGMTGDDAQPHLHGRALLGRVVVGHLSQSS
jgi:hypothetical protein